MNKNKTTFRANKQFVFFHKLNHPWGFVSVAVVCLKALRINLVYYTCVPFHLYGSDVTCLLLTSVYQISLKADCVENSRREGAISVGFRL